MAVETGLPMDDGTGEEPFVSLGERLKRAREARGMSLDDVASQTRIPIRHLQHIEQEDWDALPAVTYAIGFTRAYANAIGLDGPAIAGELREMVGGPRRRVPVADYYEPADPARVPPRSLAIGAIVFAVLLVIGYLIWRSTLDDAAAPASIPVTEAAPAPGPAAATPAPAPVAPRAAAGQPVTLTAIGDVWLRISDGGTTLFSGSLGAGQTFLVPPTAAHPVLRTGRPQLLRAALGANDIGAIEASEHTVDNVSLLAQDLAARPRVQAAPPAAAPLSVPPPQ
jgi:cytoskeleton protein RodZ